MNRNFKKDLIESIVTFEDKYFRLFNEVYKIKIEEKDVIKNRKQIKKALKILSTDGIYAYYRGIEMRIEELTRIKEYGSVVLKK